MMDDIVNDQIISSDENGDLIIQAGTLLYDYEEWHKKGSTRTKGYVEMWDYKSSLVIRPKLNVRKTGITGTGRGSLNFQLVDLDFKPLCTVTKKLTVGAELDGSATKEWKKPTIFDQKGRDKIIKRGYFCAASIYTDYDHNGMPRNLNEWVKAAGDLKALYALAVGDYATVGKWLMVKLADNP